MNLIDVTSKLATDEQCVAFLEKVRWPNGVRCPICGGDKISRVQRKNPGKNKRLNFYTCLEATCQQQFTVTSGSMFHDSHLPLHKWFLAVALMADAKKGMSASQMARQLKISCRTAWYLAHRIRKAMEGKSRQPLIVRHGRRVDETYIGGRHRSHGVRKQTRVS
jgi:transposase-like protein